MASWAAEGIGKYLQGDWDEFALSCVGALAKQARLVERLQEAENTKPYQERQSGLDLIRAIISDVRDSIVGGDIDSEKELAQLNLEEWAGRNAARSIMQILGNDTDTDLSMRFFEKVALFLVDQWAYERENRGSRGQDFEFFQECLTRLARFTLKLPTDRALAVCAPLLEAVDDYSRDTEGFLQSLVLEEDRSEGETPFWEVWQAFAEKLCQAPWVASLNSKHALGTELLNIIFLGAYWKDELLHWQRLNGQGSRIDKLV